MSQLEHQMDAVWNCYNDSNCTIANLSRTAPEAGFEFETNFDLYWKENIGVHSRANHKSRARTKSCRPEELVDKQPYTNIENLSIILSCCKGDASRALLSRTGEYQNTKTITLVRDLQTMNHAMLILNLSEMLE